MVDVNRLSLFYIRSTIHDYMYRVTGRGDFERNVTFYDYSGDDFIVDFLDTLRILKFFKDDIFIEEALKTGLRKVKEYNGKLFALAVDSYGYFLLIRLA
uniref:Uncharacterized protein n=1 Tax=Dulem virus 72 TaxID=3145783 RepID=A0AAU8B2Y7_9VIRU